MQAFRATYLQECTELLTDMEERLLALDLSNAENESLHAIFRCAHSIKGGAGAFGLTEIAQFTHVLEAVLDMLREGTLNPTREVVDLLLLSRDVVWQMVAAAREDRPLSKGLGTEVVLKLQELCAATRTAPTAADVSGTTTPTSDARQVRHYHIHFAPMREMTLRGSDPLLLLRELSRLGECEVVAHHDRLPALPSLDAEHCHLYWDIILRTGRSEADIREIFEFVEGECSLQITPHEDNTPRQTMAAAPIKSGQNKESGQPGNASGVGSIRVDIEKVDRLINMVGEIVIIQAMLAMQTRDLASENTLSEALLQGIDELNTHTRELQEAVMAVRMQPVKSIFSRMPRMVRDLSAQLGKDIRLTLNGEATEVDKTIIEQLADPLTHMLRNCVDHGIEKPEDRVVKGKPKQGNIMLSASHRGGRIVIEVLDDGAGINRDKVLAKAKERGLVGEGAMLSDSEIDQLIFRPGFSTADQVTNISGRGVGMDVVKRNIEGIGGTVALINHPGKGSQFIITLPLTLAILDGMIVRVAQEHYIIPIAHIIETLRPHADDVRQLATGQSVINIRGQFIPVLYLHRLFSIPHAQTEASKALVVLVETGQESLGLVVDELVGQQQVVIKNLEENTAPVVGVAAATILGDGRVSLILDIAGLQKIASNTMPKAA